MQSIITLGLISFIPAIQSITCNDDTNSCYTINLDDVREDQRNNALCYSYTVSLSTTGACDTIPAGDTPTVLFGVDTNACYINTADLASKISSTTPFRHTIKDDDSSGQIIGIEFEVTPDITNIIEICVQGLSFGQETTNGPFQVSDFSGECIFGQGNAINFCGICDGDEGEHSCFCSNSPNSCPDQGRPRGDLQCEWDNTNNRCIATNAAECLTGLPDMPCICFWAEEICLSEQIEGGRADCDWDAERQLCSPDECVDDIGCDCFKFQQDCETPPGSIEAPPRCIWTPNEECIEDFQTTTEPPCVDDCGCYEDRIECNQAAPELQCIWTDRCEEASTRQPTRAPVTRPPQSTRPPSISTTKKTSTTRSTTWNKPSKSWGKGGGSGKKSKGKKKGGKP